MKFPNKGGAGLNLPTRGHVTNLNILTCKSYMKVEGCTLLMLLV